MDRDTATKWTSCVDELIINELAPQHANRVHWETGCVPTVRLTSYYLSVSCLATACAFYKRSAFAGAFTLLATLVGVCSLVHAKRRETALEKTLNSFLEVFTLSAAWCETKLETLQAAKLTATQRDVVSDLVSHVRDTDIARLCVSKGTEIATTSYSIGDSIKLQVKLARLALLRQLRELDALDSRLTDVLSTWVNKTRTLIRKSASAEVQPMTANLYQLALFRTNALQLKFKLLLKSADLEDEDVQRQTLLGIRADLDSLNQLHTMLTPLEKLPDAVECVAHLSSPVQSTVLETCGTVADYQSSPAEQAVARDREIKSVRSGSTSAQLAGKDEASDTTSNFDGTSNYLCMLGELKGALSSRKISDELP